ncbi:uncharacterized protein VTP21DRAFT_2247 [Calcarisporiella thermophila]|uniref:uncharacterized protein n=1 Tax=Calcarisporiella thermophila TaxID=911321 RepID=UPI0037437C3A
MGSACSTLFFSKSRVQDTVPEIAINFEAPPTEEERGVYDRLRVLTRTAHLIESIRGYRACDGEIRKLMTSPSPEQEEETWRVLQVTAACLKEYYEYALLLEDMLPDLLRPLCANPSALEQHPGLVQLLTGVLGFVFEFDQLKMRTPAIQNDFSYYRRMLSRDRPDQANLRKAMSEDELANQISMFVAQPSPLFATLLRVASSFANKDSVGPCLPQTVASLSIACYSSLVNQFYTRPETRAQLLRSMVIAIVVYDHISGEGAFVRQSAVYVKPSVEAVQRLGGDETPALIQIIRHMTRHYNDDETPRSVRKLIESYA